VDVLRGGLVVVQLSHDVPVLILDLVSQNNYHEKIL
jgi:hypothetical protein